MGEVVQDAASRRPTFPKVEIKVATTEQQMEVTEPLKVKIEAQGFSPAVVVFTGPIKVSEVAVGVAPEEAAQPASQVLLPAQPLEVTLEVAEQRR